LNPETAIKAEKLAKSYTIWASPAARLHGPLFGRVGQWPFLPVSARLLCRRLSHESFKNFYALRDVSFEIRRGESIGIIGLNGSGKSTLLQVLAGTLQPTEGAVQTSGRVAALLELGSGFNPEFTGRENVFLNAAILGLQPAEIEARFDRIADFAEIGDFIDQPVKTYSSGMVVRLAFAVLTQVDPDILIIDEALAVGDFLFQQKCYDCLREFQKRGCTFLFVSHSMGTVLDLCGRAILLEKGCLTFDGPAKETVDVYEARSLRSRFNLGDVKSPNMSAPPSAPAQPTATAGVTIPSPVNGRSETALTANEGVAAPSIKTNAVSLKALRLLDESGSDIEVVTSGQIVRIATTISVHRQLADPHVGFKIRNVLGVVLYESNTYCLRRPLGPMTVGESVAIEFQMRLPLAEGNYSVSVCMSNEGVSQSDFKEALYFHHDARCFIVVRDQRQSTWSGIVDLQPSVSTTRRPSSPLTAT
jgi:lipopolysaccharide transport system ATP-binding protein